MYARALLGLCDRYYLLTGILGRADMLWHGDPGESVPAGNVWLYERPLGPARAVREPQHVVPAQDVGQQEVAVAQPQRIMLIHQYVVRQEAGLWQVRCDGRLVSGQPTQLAALHIAEVHAGAAAARGERSRIFVNDLDGR